MRLTTAWSLAAWLAGWSGTLGCTVGGDSSSTLSGGVSAGDATGDDEAASADEAQGTTGHADGEASSADAADTAEAADTADADASADAPGTSEGDPTTSADAEDSSDSAGSSGSESGDDLDDGILDITILAHDDCTITTIPASIAVPEGTEFTVNWISSATSEAPVDVAKIDAFNAVPIILGMEPGTSYHDEVREWCGDLFTGTFDFEITSCFDPQYIPVDCSL